MKDRVEFRFTIATGKVETKAIKALAKVAEPFIERIAEAVVNVFEVEAEKATKE